MNTLIVLWILNLEEKLDNSNERLWKRRESTAIYYLMLEKEQIDVIFLPLTLR